ncbi:MULTISPECIES: SPFH domain-containing protein [unclassified Flavobacterium]|uniref:SPFH domain-containing protein n=1 Tax=unclassified Flavobacterium TaxID=196869 RepID=UPI000F0C0673|nr:MULTISPECIES: SPFH domain-containing protein [unclassified Flavobacterium]AYN06135.1 SPFH domain-containing protein [Flavobacterium sp. 140616W15]MCD0475132.1 SPFH domain-containing protein [Flavobacterium sp. EDS]
MGIFEKLRNEFLDIIEFIDNSNNTLVYRFERYQNEIKNNSKLIVREGQQAIFMNEGKIADIFNAGTYTLNTQNLPILSTLKGWKYDFNSPFKAEVYFINTRNFIDQKWGTKNPLILNDDRFGMLEIRAFGTYTFKIVDAQKFIKEIVGTDGHFTTEEINEQLKSIIVSRFTDAIGEAKLPIESYVGNTNELSATIFAIMKDDFATYGIELSKFLLENTSMPEDVKKEIFELSRLNKIDMKKFTQYKTAQSIEKAAENPSGIAGTAFSFGTGMNMARQMMQSFEEPFQTTSFSSFSSHQIPPQTPPPLPTTGTTYFVAINNAQAGPFNESQLLPLIEKGQLLADTLVWNQGMTGWQKASSVSELQNLFSQTPPPLPNI